MHKQLLNTHSSAILKAGSIVTTLWGFSLPFTEVSTILTDVKANGQLSTIGGSWYSKSFLCPWSFHCIYIECIPLLFSLRHEGRGVDLLKHMPKIWTRGPLSKVWTFNTDHLATLLKGQEKDFKFVAWCLDSHDWTLTTSFDCQGHHCPQEKPGMEVSMDASSSLAKPPHPVILAPLMDLPSILYSIPYTVMVPTACFFSLEASLFYTTSSDTGTGRKG